MKLKSMKLLKTNMNKDKSVKKFRTQSNDVESTKYSNHKNSSISKIQKNKTLLSMFGIDKPENERMKQLGISTLANKKRLLSAKSSMPNILHKKNL